MNYAVMSGNVGHDPVLRSTAKGKTVTNLSIAVWVGTDAQGNSITEWFDWVIWGDLAEHVANGVRKGDKVTICGKASKAPRKTKSGDDYKGVMFVASEVVWQKKSADPASLIGAQIPMPNEEEYDW